jgi:hypothetical protein
VPPYAVAVRTLPSDATRHAADLDDGPPMRTNVSTIALIVVLSSGCSLVFTQGPSSNHDDRARPHCSTNPAPVAIDAIDFITDAILIGVFAGDSSVAATQAAKATGIAGFGVAAAVAGVSALVGARRVSRCGNAHREWDAQHPYLQQ